MRSDTLCGMHGSHLHQALCLGVILYSTVHSVCHNFDQSCTQTGPHFALWLMMMNHDAAQRQRSCGNGCKSSFALTHRLSAKHTA